LRFGLLAYTVQGRDVNLDIKRVVGYRQFCNKLWNAVKFALTYLTDFEPSPTMLSDISINPNTSPRDLFIISRLNATIKECNFQLSQYNFGAVTTALHSFFLYDFCDLYLELIKPVVNNDENLPSKRCAQATLFICLEYFLRLTHPIMPFVTEELWQRLPYISKMSSSSSIMTAEYPKDRNEWNNPNSEYAMSIIKDMIHHARSLRVDYHIANHIKADFYFRTDSKEVESIIKIQMEDFCTLSKGNFLKQILPDIDPPKGASIKVISDNLCLLIDLTELIDLDMELNRLEKEKSRLDNQIDQYKKKIEAPGYENKVPETVKIANSEKLASLHNELHALNSAIETFEKMKLNN
jgi:valyl-tRNA synthetase